MDNSSLNKVSILHKIIPDNPNETYEANLLHEDLSRKGMNFITQPNNNTESPKDNEDENPSNEKDVLSTRTKKMHLQP